jgi:hypothetical protein
MAKRCPAEVVAGERPWENRRRDKAEQLKEAAWFAEEVCEDLGLGHVFFNAVAARRRRTGQFLIRVILEHAPSISVLRQIETGPLIGALVWWYERYGQDLYQSSGKWENGTYIQFCTMYDGITFSVKRRERKRLEGLAKPKARRPKTALDGVR